MQRIHPLRMHYVLNSVLDLVTKHDQLCLYSALSCSWPARLQLLLVLVVRACNPLLMQRQAG